MKVSRDQERVMIELADTLIPGGQTPGAASVFANLFVLKMLDDCYTEQQQVRFLLGLQEFNEASFPVSRRYFTEASPEERATLLTMIENKKFPDKELNYFYGEMKRLTIQAYTTSKYFLTNIHIYELVPGRWHGCVPVNKTPNKTA